MDLTALRYLEAVSRHGSLSSAARALKVAQPTLTLAMRNLEKRFSTTLLVRSRNGVALTPSGEELLRHSQDIFALLELRILQIVVCDRGFLKSKRKYEKEKRRLLAERRKQQGQQPQ